MNYKGTTHEQENSASTETGQTELSYVSEHEQMLAGAEIAQKRRSRGGRVKSRVVSSDNSSRKRSGSVESRGSSASTRKLLSSSRMSRSNSDAALHKSGSDLSASSVGSDLGGLRMSANYDEDDDVFFETSEPHDGQFVQREDGNYLVLYGDDRKDSVGADSSSSDYSSLSQYSDEDNHRYSAIVDNHDDDGYEKPVSSKRAKVRFLNDMVPPSSTSVYEDIDTLANVTQASDSRQRSYEAQDHSVEAKGATKHKRPMKVFQRLTQDTTHRGDDSESQERYVDMSSVKTLKTQGLHNSKTHKLRNRPLPPVPTQNDEHDYEPIEAPKVNKPASVMQYCTQAEERIAQLHQAAPTVRNAYARQIYRITPQELQMYDKRQHNAKVVFTYKSQRDIKRKLRVGDLKPEDVHRRFKKGECADMDAKELRELIAPSMYRVIGYRNIDVTKPVKVVFMEYDGVLQKSTKLPNGVGQIYQDVTRLGQALVDSVHDTSLQENTIYIIASGRIGEWPKQKKQFDNLGLFDMCITMEPTRASDAVLKNRRIFGRLKDATSQFKGSYANELDSAVYFFKQNVVRQVLDILQKDLQVAHIDVVIVDRDAVARRLARMECEQKNIDSFTLVDPSDISGKHIACIVGNCTNEQHKPTTEIAGDNNSAVSYDSDTDQEGNSLIKCRYFNVEVYNKCKRLEAVKLGLSEHKNIKCAHGCSVSHNKTRSDGYDAYHQQLNAMTLFDFFQNIFTIHT